MPLSHAILGFLEYGPMSGYDLKKNFDQSVAHFWSATQSHIYRALEDLESEGWVTSQVIQQEGKPNRKQYQITAAGKAELRRWLATPLPMTGPRSAWLIQIFFAHNLSNEEIVNLFEKRIENLRTYLSRLQGAQQSIDENSRKVGLKRVQNLWQLTLDYGIDNYTSEISWLEKILPVVRKLPPLASPKR
ncbi:MAG TPA: PadR family transcriptional regulator [Anaerolineales bacterium]|nr:PadR family transcriptional regulator [Anaerolineales bacterium]